MSDNLKATPRAILRGIRDTTRAQVTPVPELLPQHLPLVFHFMERGDATTPHIAISDEFNQLFGSKSVDLQGKYANHATVLANLQTSTGNLIMWKRLKPDAAKTAMLRISVEVIPALVPVWERELGTGAYKYNALGQRIQATHLVDSTPTYVVGQRLIWRTDLTPYATNALKAFGGGATISDVRDGATTLDETNAPLSTLFTNPASGDGVAVKSKVYPWMDLEVSTFGDYGNNVGVRLWAPNAADLLPGNPTLMNQIQSYLYRIALIERPDAVSSSVVQETLAGDQYLDLSFLDGIVHPVTAQDLSVDSAIIDRYESKNLSGFNPVYGPFGRVHVYRSQIAAVLQLLADGGEMVRKTANGTGTPTIGEGAYDESYIPLQITPTATFSPRGDNWRFATTTNAPIPEHRPLLNPFTGKDQYGVPYYTFDVEASTNFGGALIGPNTDLFAVGGDDGLPLDSHGKPDKLNILKLYDQLVAAELTNFGNVAATGWAGKDMLKYPFRCIHDTGFSLSTKMKMLIPVSRRKDVGIFWTPQSIAEWSDAQHPSAGGNVWSYRPLNTAAEDNAIASILRQTAQAYPESEIYGTPCVRAVFWGRAGYLNNSLYTGLLPLSVERGYKMAAYMGAADGRWASGQRFDENPGNIVSLFRDINVVYSDDDQADSDWEQGLNWVQSFDTRQVFWPSSQTVYPDDTSVLNSALMMLACCEVELVCQRVWARLTGNSSLTEDQFIERSNTLISEALAGRFDNNFVFEPETYFTSTDRQLGWRWSTKVKIYGNTMKTVGVMTVESHNLSELTA